MNEKCKCNVEHWLNPLNKLKFIKAAITLNSNNEFFPSPNYVVLITCRDGRTYQISKVPSAPSHFLNGSAPYNGAGLRISLVPQTPYDYESAIPLPCGVFEMGTVLDKDGAWFDEDNEKRGGRWIS